MDIQILASSSSGNCYKVSDGKTTILLDVGIPFSKIKEKLDFNFYQVDAVLVTHEHLDHSKAVKDILKTGIDVYMSEGTLKALNLENDFIKPHTISKLKEFTYNTFVILPFDVEHDAQEPLGFLIYSTVTKEKLLFATDTYYIKYQFTSLNYIMLECNYDIRILRENYERGKIPLAFKNRLLQSHFSLENVKKFLQSNDLSKVKEIYLIHLSNSNSDARKFKEEVQKVTGKSVTVCES
jgi:phosphoribosyl 1,2-cyclic phosphodiesterase